MIKYQDLNPDPLTKSLFQSQIQTAPWCFPTTFQNANTLPVGVCPIITVDRQKKTSVMVLLPQKPNRSIERFFPVVQQRIEFQRSLHNVHRWFETELPVWLNNQAPLQPFIHCIRTDSGISPEYIDGHSAGVALLLSQLSLLLKEPLPKTLICSTAIDQSGSLLPVQALENKLQAIARHCPIIETVIVCTSQKEQAVKVLATLNLPRPLEIIGLQTIQEILITVKLNNQKSILQNLEMQLQQKDLSLFIDFLFFRVLKGKSQIFGWSSLHKTLSQIQEHSAATLTEKERQQIKLLSLVSSRYAQKTSQTIQLRTTDIDWVLQRPLPLLLQVWPHLLQQLASHPETIEAAAQSTILEKTKDFLPDDNAEITAPPFLRIMGANARLHRKRGRLNIAFQDQLHAFYGWLNNSIYDEASYPLCELLELAGELNTNDIHHQAKTCYRLLHNRPGAIQDHNQGYILCAEMTRRQANQENWKELRDILLSPQSRFPHQLKEFVQNKIEFWNTAQSGEQI